MIKYADMHSKGISLVYKYDEGRDLDFDIGLYFYEQLCKFLEVVTLIKPKLIAF
jgi:hypothetical protein